MPVAHPGEGATEAVMSVATEGAWEALERLSRSTAAGQRRGGREEAHLICGPESGASMQL